MELAKIEAQTEQYIHESEKNKAVTTTQISAQYTHEDNKLFIYIALIGSVVAGLLFITLYLINKRNKEMQLTLQNEQHKHEIALKEREIYKQQLEKIMELLTSSNVPDEVKLNLSKNLTFKDQSFIELNH